MAPQPPLSNSGLIIVTDPKYESLGSRLAYSLGDGVEASRSASATFILWLNRVPFADNSEESTTRTGKFLARSAVPPQRAITGNSITVFS